MNSTSTLNPNSALQGSDAKRTYIGMGWRLLGLTYQQGE
jgi:hypothetical protein